MTHTLRSHADDPSKGNCAISRQCQLLIWHTFVKTCDFEIHLCLCLPVHTHLISDSLRLRKLAVLAYGVGNISSTQYKLQILWGLLDKS